MPAFHVFTSSKTERERKEGMEKGAFVDVFVGETEYHNERGEHRKTDIRISVEKEKEHTKEENY